jgi:hypothetical protein
MASLSVESRMTFKFALDVLPHVSKMILGGGPYLSSNRTKSLSFVSTTEFAIRASSKIRYLPRPSDLDSVPPWHPILNGLQSTVRLPVTIEHRSRSCGQKYRMFDLEGGVLQGRLEIFSLEVGHFF